MLLTGQLTMLTHPFNLYVLQTIEHVMICILLWIGFSVSGWAWDWCSFGFCSLVLYKELLIQVLKPRDVSLFFFSSLLSLFDFF